MSKPMASHTSRETRDDSSSPPAYTAPDLEPPPYSAKSTAPILEPTQTSYQSFADIYPSSADTCPLLASSSFDDSTVRRGFVRKVFCIVTLMLLITFGVVCVFTFSSVVKEAVQNNMWAYFSSFIVFLVVAIALSLCPSFSRRHPWNIVALVVVNLSMSYMVGAIASYHDTAIVIITMGVTVAISFAIIVFSLQTRFDLTIWSGVLLILLVDLLLFGICCTFYYSYVMDLLYSCLGALLYSLFLMIDVQLMTGMMSHRVDPEEYINAALNIYLDIVLIFLYLLGRR